MIKTAMAFLVGCLLCLSLKEMPEPSWIFLLVVIAALWLRRAVFTAFIVGLLWAGFQAQLQLNDRLPLNLAGKDILTSGNIVAVPAIKDRLIRFEFAPDSDLLPDKVRLSWYQPPSHPPQAGERWQLQLRLKSPHGMMNPGSFDYEKWLFTESIGATGYIRDSQSNQRLQAAEFWSIHSLRQRIQQQLTALLPESQQLPLLQGLAIGIRDDLNASHWQTLRQTGTSHLVAISGLHIGLAAALGFFLFRFLWSLFPTLLLRFPAQHCGAVGSICLAAFYACLAGLSVPTQRALIMVSALMLALLIKRPPYPLHILAFSLLLVLIVDPFAAISAGFWLSFSAVALIIFTCSQRYPSWRWRWAGIHFWIALGLMPLLVLFFGQVSIISPLANLLAVPLVSLLVVPFILAGMLLLSVSETLAAGLFKAADYLLDLMWQWLTFLAASPVSDWHTPALPTVLIIFSALSLLLLLLPRRWPAKWLGLVLLLPLFYYQVDKPEPGQFYLSLLDVGQGLATVIETQNHALVFDVGPKYSESFDTGSAVVAPFLNYRGIRALDTLVISHGDNDHIGGAESLIKQTPITTIFTSDIAALPQAMPCQTGHQWIWDNVSFEFLQPFPDQSGSNNDRSCVLKIEGVERSALLPGDIETESELRLVRHYGDKLKADILIVPHHGSRTSSSKAFIKAVKPDYALLPVGYKNRYGFPVKTVIERYLEQDIKVLRTDHQGAILFKQASHPITWRRYSSHFWTSKATE